MSKVAWARALARFAATASDVESALESVEVIGLFYRALGS
jgi:hypothetical protein